MRNAATKEAIMYFIAFIVFVFFDLYSVFRLRVLPAPLCHAAQGCSRLSPPNHDFFPPTASTYDSEETDLTNLFLPKCQISYRELGLSVLQRGQLHNWG
jgi:hypothetical protein